MKFWTENEYIKKLDFLKNGFKFILCTSCNKGVKFTDENGIGSISMGCLQFSKIAKVWNSLTPSYNYIFEDRNFFFKQNLFPTTSSLIKVMCIFSKILLVFAKFLREILEFKKMLKIDFLKKFVPNFFAKFLVRTLWRTRKIVVYSLLPFHFRKLPKNEIFGPHRTTFLKIGDFSSNKSCSPQLVL